MTTFTNGAIVGHSETRAFAVASIVPKAGFALLISNGAAHAASGLAADSNVSRAGNPAPQLTGDSLWWLSAGDVELREPEALRQIVRNSSEVASLIADAIQELRKAFGAGATKIAVEPFFDPEVVGAQPRVFVIAVTELSFVRADAILETVLDGWWSENQGRANRSVSLGTEFV